VTYAGVEIGLANREFLGWVFLCLGALMVSDVDLYFTEPFLRAEDDLAYEDVATSQAPSIFPDPRVFFTVVPAMIGYAPRFDP